MSDRNPTAEWADRLTRYGELVAGFCVLQAVAFLYSLGENGSVRNQVTEAWVVVCIAVLVVSSFYGFLCKRLGRQEALLRRADNQPEAVLAASKTAVNARIGTVVFSLAVVMAFPLQGAYKNGDIADWGLGKREVGSSVRSQQSLQ